ncbi:MAG: hypothetical protein BWX71_01848 [Deltaproteobacteria bacterium ADurb.Bin072]|nr:MAG: hypothetical protein BWX71_01848 [Deltaproteobacteria bacterium ADurb.Bin072]
MSAPWVRSESPNAKMAPSRRSLAAFFLAVSLGLIQIGPRPRMVTWKQYQYPSP